MTPSLSVAQSPGSRGGGAIPTTRSRMSAFDALKRVDLALERLSHRGAESCAVTLNLAQSVVAAGFRTCKHPVEAIDEVQDAEFRDVDTGEVGGAAPP
jgi:hypothetical protein